MMSMSSQRISRLRMSDRCKTAELQKALLPERRPLPSERARIFACRTGQAWMPTLAALIVGIALVFLCRSFFPDLGTTRAPSKPKLIAVSQQHVRLNEPVQSLHTAAHLNP